MWPIDELSEFKDKVADTISNTNLYGFYEQTTDSIKNNVIVSKCKEVIEDVTNIDWKG